MRIHLNASGIEFELSKFDHTQNVYFSEDYKFAYSLKSKRLFVGIDLYGDDEGYEYLPLTKRAYILEKTKRPVLLVNFNQIINN